MGLLSWFFGESKNESLPLVNLKGTGAYNLEVVGEASYQSALVNICGGHSPDGHKLQVRAILTHEDGNRHDDKAVRVDIEGQTVGYLNRENARQYRQKLTEAGFPGHPAACDAKIVGGRVRKGGEKTHFGVYLDLPTGE